MTTGADPQTEGAGRSRIEAAFDLLPDALIVFDAAGRLSGCNRAARRSLGVADDAATPDLGGLLAAAPGLAPEDRAELARAFEVAASGGGGEAIVRCASGQIFTLVGHGFGDGWTVALATEPTRPRSATLHGEIDALTGLMNRAAFRESISDAEIEMRSRAAATALLYLDLDRFKQVNDTLGHAIGDTLLARAAERMRKALRSDDTLGRLGGDEFGVITRTASREAVEALAARLIDFVSRPYLIDGHLITVGVSVGAAFMPADAAKADDLARCADLALYSAKDDGRGTLRFFRPAMSEQAAARRLLEIDLRKAMVLGEFELHYQPQMPADGGEVVGFEALLRWNHPTRGRVSPADFIPVAEETGQIVAIGEWVLRTAAAEAATWPERVAIAVNVSPIQFRSNRLVETVAAVLERTGLAPHRLEIEITEGVLLHDEQTNLATLARIHAMGVRVAIDDFGTGYASLAYLKRFPFDKIKIDQSFVREMMSSADSDAIVGSIVSLGRKLGMTTIAEGVETAEQLRRIRSHGCAEVQGYLTGRPMSQQDVRDLLNPERGRDARRAT